MTCSLNLLAASCSALVPVRVCVFACVAVSSASPPQFAEPAVDVSRLIFFPVWFQMKMSGTRRKESFAMMGAASRASEQASWTHRTHLVSSHRVVTKDREVQYRFASL